MYSRDPCACSDQLHIGFFCALAAVWLTALKFIMAAFEMSVGGSLCKTSTTDRERGTGGEQGWMKEDAREKTEEMNAGN